MLAHQRGDDIVLSTHIDEALNIIEDRYKYQRSKECFKIIGATLFGVFLQGFITELTTGHALNLVLYTVSGFLGMLFVFLGLRK
jgi:hypothetical protein